MKKNNQGMAALFMMLLIITMLLVVMLNKMDNACRVTYIYTDSQSEEVDN